jgi:hypothetical protein
VRAFCTILVLSVAALGCSGEDDQPAVLGAYPLPECPKLETEPCDTRASACQRRLLELAACVYGVDNAPDVPIRVVSESQLVDELEALASEQPDAEDSAHLPQLERALVDMQLVLPGDLTQGHGRIEDIIDRVDGVYQDAERGIALVDRGRPQDSAESAAVLVHELVHAIQDAAYDLNDWQRQYPDELDTLLALRSVSEGQATYAQFRVVYAMLGYDLTRFELSTPIEAFRSKLMRSAALDASPYIASLTTFPYAVGVSVAERGWSQAEPHFDATQFESPPLTTLKALSESYALELPSPQAIELTAPTPDADYELLETSVLGAFMFELFLIRHGLEPELARAQALDWQADRLWIYRGPEQQTGFVWEVQLQSIAFESFFEQAAPPVTGSVREQQGRRMFLAGSSPAPEFLRAAGRKFLDAASE